MQTPILASIAALAMALSAPSLAQNQAAHAGHGAAPASASTDVDADAVMTAGEITRVDARTGRLTIRHEDIKNLNMPAMTMVFGLKDAGQAAQFKAGDKVRFHAQDDNGNLGITRIERAP